MNKKQIAEEIKKTEERLAELRAKLEEPELKYKVGDKVLVEAIVCGRDADCPNSLVYRVKSHEGDTGGIWFTEGKIHSKLEPEWHNPDYLSQDYIGEGYRLLTKEEVQSRQNLAGGTKGVYIWQRGLERWCGNGNFGYAGSNEDFTYKVRADKYPVGSLEIT